MPCGLSWIESPSDIATTANFGRSVRAEAETAVHAGHRRGVDDVTALAVRADMRQEAADAVHTPIRLTSITHRQLSSEMLSMPPPAATPALLQTTCTWPNASKATFAAASTLPGSATSQPMPRTFGP